MTGFIRLLYAILIAGAVVTFVGVGISTFYPGPKGPEYPVYTANEKDSQKAYEEFDKKQKDFKPVQNNYYRNVAIVGVVLAVAALAAGLKLLSKMEVIGEGLALGGLATSVYAIITSSMGEQKEVRFLSVAVLLVGALLLTQRRFVPETVKAKKKR
jgi:hypothetical protein